MRSQTNVYMMPFIPIDGPYLIWLSLFFGSLDVYFALFRNRWHIVHSTARPSSVPSIQIFVLTIDDTPRYDHFQHCVSCKKVDAAALRALYQM